MKYLIGTVGVGFVVAAVALAVAGLVADPDDYGMVVVGGILLIPAVITLAAASSLSDVTLGPPAFVRKGVGVPGTAAVLTVRDTGMTISSGATGRDAAVVEMQLRIARDGAPPAEMTHRQAVPRLALGAVLPGAELPVLVDRTDPGSIYIDWSAALGPGVGLGAGTTPNLYAGSFKAPESAAELLATGEPALATIVKHRLLGTARTLEVDSADPAHLDHAVHLFTLRVERMGHRPYKVRVAHRVPPEVEASVRPGLALPVAVDPGRRRRVAINWSALGR